MNSNPYSHNFVDLLNSQQETVFGFKDDSVELSSSHDPFFGSQATEASNYVEETPVEHRERRIWTPIDDVVLISSWLTQARIRIAAYFAASPKVAGSEHREASHCKQRWQKTNDQVNKFSEAYEATKHAWKELRNDQKWCEISKSKTHGSANKRRKLDEGAQSSTYHVSEANDGDTDRLPGVKAAKGKGKKMNAEGKALSEFESMWSFLIV
uniref:Myb-like domain-containing protein n=1 Tax=Brassica oleracea TaxID=3712 RepID=A0A3P6CPA8_BRAOL|nr:unnamed protein product [Brassica oleracea]